MRQIKVSAPGKLMLFGEHAVIYDKPCIVTAVDQRISTRVRLIKEKQIRIKALQVGIEDYEKQLSRLDPADDLPKGVRFLEVAVRNFADQYGLKRGLKIETKSEFSSQFGFGSSSAVTVGVLKALSELTETKMDKQELFDLAYKTVLDVQGVGSGFDIAAAIWGGSLYFVKGGKEIEPLKTKELPLVVGYTGVKADTASLVRQVAQLRQANSRIVEGVFKIIEQLTEEAKVILNKEKPELSLLGSLMDINQGLLDSLGVNTGQLSSLIYAARQAGAMGAKLSGAGGGDCMIALVEPKKRGAVERVMEEAGGKVIPIKNGAQGARKEQIR